MITVLVGDDSFAIDDRLRSLRANFEGEAERIDGSSVEMRQLPDLLTGSSLFSEKRLVIIRDLSKNSAVWGSFPDWIGRVSDDIHLVLVEDKIDKRTQAYKELKKKSDLQEFTSWGDRDYHQAEAWASARAKTAGLEADSRTINYLVQRVGLDKWRLAQAIEMLSLLNKPVNKDIIDETVVASVSENVFALFEASIQGDVARVQEMIRTLETQEDAYAVFGIAASQTVQMLALSRTSGEDSPEKDFSIHPYVASKLKQSVRQRGARGVEEMAEIIAQTDYDMKTLSADPWLLVEQALVAIAQKK